ncbi:MAG: hypothetical protein J2P53_11645 [Bradyrhizobiaceae bacterium]|nr:hypothetical protein [Bradyrhizobiaceae bacterium]
MMRAIKTTIAALGVVGATAVTAPAPASAQVFWPGFSVGFSAPVYSFYRPVPWGFYRPVAFGAFGYQPAWRFHHVAWGYRPAFGAYGYRHVAWGCPRLGWGNRYYGMFGRRLAVYRPYAAYGRWGGYGFRHFGFWGHRFHHVGFVGPRFRHFGFVGPRFRHFGFARFARFGHGVYGRAVGVRSFGLRARGIGIRRY